jgi:hypothetical protein
MRTPVVPRRYPASARSTLRRSARTSPAKMPAAVDVGSTRSAVSGPGWPEPGRYVKTAPELVNNTENPPLPGVPTST